MKRLFARYVEMKLAQQVLDFDDLLLYWHALMQDARLAQDVGALFDHVLVDEYQDTNTLQAEILLALKPAGAGVVRRGRRRAVDLFVPRRDGREHPAVPAALHPGRRTSSRSNRTIAPRSRSSTRRTR